MHEILINSAGLVSALNLLLANVNWLINVSGIEYLVEKLDQFLCSKQGNTNSATNQPLFNDSYSLLQLASFFLKIAIFLLLYLLFGLF